MTQESPEVSSCEHGDEAHHEVIWKNWGKAPLILNHGTV